MGRVLLGGIVGGIVIFVWSAVVHMALPLGEMGVRQIKKEPAVIGSFQLAITEPGFYYFPGLEHGRTASPAECQAWNEKVEQGPTGILVIHPEGHGAVMTKQMGLEFATNVIAGRFWWR